MKTFILIFLSSCTLVSFAQDSAARHKKPIPVKQLFKPSHIGFTVIPFFTQKAKISEQKGNYAPGADIMTGIEAGAEYRLNFKTNYSLIAGIHGVVSGRDYTLHIPKEDFVLPLKYGIDITKSYSRQYDYLLSVPVWAERRFNTKKGNHWNLDAGINVRFYYGRLFETDGAYGYHTNQQPIRVYDMKLKIGNDAWPWINYNIGGGYSFRLRNQNFLRVNALVNLSGFEPVRGSYTIDVTGKELSTGAYSAKMEYAGLSVSYILTRGKKQAHKKVAQQIKK